MWGDHFLPKRIQALVQPTSRVSRCPILVILDVLILQAMFRPHLGVPAHTQLHDVPLELVGVRGPSLAHKEARSRFEGQGAGFPLQCRLLCLPAVHVEGGCAALHAQGQAGPAAGQCRQREAGSGPGGPQQQLQLLAAVVDGSQLQPRGHRSLCPVRDRQKHPRPARRRPHMQQQREVLWEAGGQVGVRRDPATRVLRGLKGEGLGVQPRLPQRPHPRGQRLPEQLRQRQFQRPARLCGGRHAEQHQRCQERPRAGPPRLHSVCPARPGSRRGGA